MGNFQSVTYPRARKPRPCGECDAEIRAGDVYCRNAGCFDGYMSVDVSCADCAAWAGAYLEAARKVEFHVCAGPHGDGEYAIGSMWEAIAEFCREHLDYDPEEKL